MNEFDFSVGGEGYKQRFANRETSSYRLEFFPGDAPGGIRMAARGASEAIKAHPRIGPRAARSVKLSRAFLDRVGNSLKRRGVFGTIAQAFRSAVRRFIFDRAELLVYRSGPDARPASNVRLVPELSAGFADLKSLTSSWAAEAEGAVPLDPCRARERVRAGKRCFAVHDGPRLVHYSWIAEADAVTASETPGCSLPLESPGVVISDCWTAESRRGRGIYPAVLRALAEEARAGSKDAWIYCLKENVPSSRGITKAGFEHRWTFGYRKVLGWEKSWVESTRGAALPTEH